jgi:hypothetical protein
LTDAVKYPAGARPSKCYLFIYLAWRLVPSSELGYNSRGQQSLQTEDHSLTHVNLSGYGPKKKSRPRKDGMDISQVLPQATSLPEWVNVKNATDMVVESLGQ